MEITDKTADKKLGENELILMVLKHLLTAISHLQLFFIDHPLVTDQINKAFYALSNLTRITPETILVLMEGKCIVNGRPVKGKSPILYRFKQILKDNAIETITFSAGITKDELTGFMANIASKKRAAIHSTQCITLGKIVVKNNLSLYGAGQGLPISSDVSEDNILIIPTGKTAAQSGAIKELTSLTQIKELIQNFKPGSKNSRIRQLKSAVCSFIKGFSHAMKPMEYLGDIKSFDEYTFVHVSNVFVLTLCQAESLGFRGRQLYDIGMASVLHDTGKLFIPDDIIHKPGELTEKERVIVQSHSVQGARYLMGIPDIPKLAVISALDHHIRFNGTGYPAIKRCRPNIVSQMIAISDAFDAMRSRRPYQEPKSIKSIITILGKERGIAFNPILVDNFLTLLKRSSVAVGTGQTADNPVL